MLNLSASDLVLLRAGFAPVDAPWTVRLAPANSGATVLGYVRFPLTVPDRDIIEETNKYGLIVLSLTAQSGAWVAEVGYMARQGTGVSPESPALSICCVESPLSRLACCELVAGVGL